MARFASSMSFLFASGETPASGIYISSFSSESVVT
jgi:hypothetical protein